MSAGVPLATATGVPMGNGVGAQIHFSRCALRHCSQSASCHAPALFVRPEFRGVARHFCTPAVAEGRLASSYAGHQ